MIRVRIRGIVSDTAMESYAGPMILREVKDNLRASLANELFKHHDLTYAEAHHPSAGETDIYMQTFALSRTEIDALRKFFVGMPFATNDRERAQLAQDLVRVLDQESTRMEKDRTPIAPDTTSPEAKRLLAEVESADTRREEP